MNDELALFEHFFNERLKERGMTLKRLSELSGISQKHLEYLARGEFGQLPPAPYIRGYFQKIAPHLECDLDEWWNRIKNNPEIKSSGLYDTLPANRFAKRSFRTYIIGGAILLFVILFFGARLTKILGAPSLALISPAESFITTSIDRFLITGTALNTTQLAVNGEAVSIDTSGKFEKEIVLEPGLNTVVIMGKKFLGGESTLSRQIFYEAPPTPAQPKSPSAPPQPTPATSTTPESP